MKSPATSNWTGIPDADRHASVAWMAPLAYKGKPQSRKSIISLSEWEGSNAVLKVWNKPPNRTVGAVYAPKQRTNALWTATRYELSFQHGNLIVWYWFSAGCAGGDRFCRRSLRPAAVKWYMHEIGGLLLAAFPRRS